MESYEMILYKSKPARRRCSDVLGFDRGFDRGF